MLKKVSTIFLIGLLFCGNLTGDESQNVSNSPNYNSWGADFAFDKDGILYTVWNEFDAITQYYCFSKSGDNGTTWSESIVLTETQWGNVQGICIDCDSNGYIHVIYAKDCQLFHSASQNGGVTWTTAVCTTSTIEGHSLSPDFIIDKSDSLHLVWSCYEGDRNGTPIYNAYYTNSSDSGSSWSTPDKLSEDLRRAEVPIIATDSFDNPHVVWFEQSPFELPPYETVYRFREGGFWSEKIAILSTDQLQGATGITIDNLNRIHIVLRNVWIPKGIFHCMHDGNQWGELNPIYSGEDYFEFATITHDNQNNLIAVWQSNTSGWLGDKFEEPFNLQYSINIDDKWSVPQQIEQGPFSYLWGVYTNIELGKDGNLHVVWSKGDLTDYSREVYHKEFNPYPYIEVAIDIKPGSYPNSINLGSNGNVPVAIFSTEDFDATIVDPLTVTLAGAEVKIKGKGTPMSFAEDLDGDGLLDLVIHVDTTALQLSMGDIEAVLEGLTYDGMKIRGVDTVRIIRE